MHLILAKILQNTQPGLLSALFVPEEIVGEPGVLIAPVMTPDAKPGSSTSILAESGQQRLVRAAKNNLSPTRMCSIGSGILEKSGPPMTKWHWGAFVWSARWLGCCAAAVDRCTFAHPTMAKQGLREKDRLLTWAQNLFRSALRRNSMTEPTLRQSQAEVLRYRSGWMGISAGW